jgi:hypothetical protein
VDDFRYDLSAALPAIKATGRHQELVDAIERTMSTGSAHQDLSQAREALSLLRRLTKDREFADRFEEGDLSTMAGALFSKAIILYARATNTKPIDRRKWFGETKLSAEERKVHQTTMDLRDHAIAHFGYGKDALDGGLASEALVIRRVDHRVHVAFYSSRSENRAAFSRELLGLVERVLSLAYDATQARYADLGKAIGAASQRDPSLPALMREFEFDPVAFHPAPNWQARADAGPRVGTQLLHNAVKTIDP